MGTGKDPARPVRAPKRRLGEEPAPHDRPEIPLRELRNSISRVLAAVDRGRTFRVTVGGRAVADLVPVSQRRTWVPREVLERILHETPLDERFLQDVDGAVDQSTDPR